jgi:membrane glycosyltransferase
MIVLDADSVMSGQTMARLSVDMERHPHLGLIQTVPTVMGAATLFARWQQFASRLFGPISAAGMIWWAGSEGMFWGHNAIVRVRAFAESCGLPELPGRAPFGGHILSHDMLEAALLRRRGWDVHMVTADDSFEEFPPAMPDLFTRDRRWCQGNIQHVPLLAKIKGLHPVSRFQLFVGASAYCTSPLWLAMMLVVLGGVATGVWPPAAVLPSSTLLTVTAVLLFGPKILAIGWAMADPSRRIGFGGDACADPLTGIHAAHRALAQWHEGMGAHLMLSMSAVVAEAIGWERARDAESFTAKLQRWAAAEGAPFPAVASRTTGPVAALGQDNGAWLC